MSEEMSEAARRGLQRAGIHLMRAAIEVVEGVAAFLEEMQRADGEAGDGGAASRGPERIVLDPDEE